MAEIVSVYSLNFYVKKLIEDDNNLACLAVRGEIDNFVHHRSGHLYFSLKDERATVKCVMFKGWARELSFEPKSGMKVVIRAKASLYEQGGSFQLYVEHIFPDGIGSAQIAFEQLKAKLTAEGLLDDSRKKMIPKRIKTIGLITSRSGAALQDILNVSQRRWPLAHFLLYSVNVQGSEAVQEIVSGIEHFKNAKNVDVVLITRGGGSKEDLWVFNHESIARAVCTCCIPVISAVGHEIDYTILDFVADLRAPTPSAAAELLCPDKTAEKEHLYLRLKNAKMNIQNRIQMCYNQTGVSYNAAKNSAHVFADLHYKQCSDYWVELHEMGKSMVEKRHIKLYEYASVASALNPMGVLARGYSVTEDLNGNLCQVQDLHKGQKIKLHGQSAIADCEVINVEKMG